ncbi:MAG: DNA repair protein RecN [Muribaculaceae bacterium]
MIVSLSISNYALIDHLEIALDGGFNIITGETGAGKSIILGALGMLLGARADARVIRNAQSKSVVEAEFRPDEQLQSVLAPILAEAQVDDGGEVCILRRELSPTGRTRAFVNDTPVTLTLLRRVAVHLVDIHSQHQNLLLADTAYQLSVIDHMAANGPLLAAYRAAYGEYKQMLQQYIKTRDMVSRNKADADFIAYQLEELNDMQLRAGEQAELESRRQMLANAGVLQEHLGAAVAALGGTDSGALDALDTAIANCRSMGAVIADADDLADRLDSVAIEVKDILDTLAARADGITADPEMLVAIEERLSRLYSLELKHHVDTVDELIAVRDKMAEQLEAISNSDDVLASLEASARELKRKAMALARKLSERRREAADAFAERLRVMAAPLGMANLRCEVAMTQGKLGADGIDALELLFAFNKNQMLSSVAATASGGEISRLMLCVKSILAEKMSLPSIIFDEIDTGVSGDIANRIARMMADIARRIQVVTITHLPQVAARGRCHFKVYKEDNDTATATRISRLTSEQRVSELALMLSGDPHDEAALEAARAMLRKASAEGADAN